LVLFAVAPVLALYWPFCTPVVQPTVPPAQVRFAELWQPADDLHTRDVRHGRWGADFAPDPSATYRFLKPKTSGVNPGMTVRDPMGRKWSVKQAPHDGRKSEGPIEVVVSRILSAVGYHQPPVYFLPSFLLADASGERREPGGRFRLDHAALKDRGEWSWQQNPFVGTSPYQGLLVILLLLNSSDLKNENNTLYEFTSSSGQTERWYVVRDLGTALGGTGRLEPTRGDIELFERLPFVTGVRNGTVSFVYDGWHQELIRNRITPADVGWGCDLLARLTPRQWRDIFDAAGYRPEEADRYIRRVHEKIAEGQALAARWRDG
jgi:hypothetical protein